MEESEASTHMSEDAFFQQCCRGFEYAEDVLESFVKKAVEKIHTDLKDSLKIVIGCIRDTEKDMIRNKGLISTILEHQCKKMPACNELVKLLVSKLPFAFQANRAKLFRVMLQNGLWEFAKLFLEPWMWSLCGFEKLDAFCLLVLIDNTSTFNHESLPWTSRHMHTRRALYQNRVHKIRLIAEACFRTDNEALKKEERDVCLHAIIDMLSFVSRDKDADVAIENILKIKDNPRLEMEGRLQQKRLDLKQVMTIFERKMRQFASRIPHEEPETRGSVQIGQNTNMKSITEPEQSGNNKEITNEEYELIQALIYSVEKSLPFDGPGIVKTLLVAKNLADQEFVEMPAVQFKAMQKALEGQMHAKQLQQLICLEMESTYFKVCHQSFLKMEDVLRKYCKIIIALKHREVRKEFPRKKLCADKNDIFSVNKSQPEDIKFKHDCKEDPDCNTFLKAVESQKSPNCALTLHTMFKNVNPQDCIDDVWIFLQVFLEPSMRTFDGLADLDVYCLLTLYQNIWMDKARQKYSGSLLGKICKVKDDACNLLKSTNREMAREEMECCVKDIMYILKEGMLPGAHEVIHQIVPFIRCTMVPNFDITLPMETKRLQHIKCFYDKSCICDRNLGNWCKLLLTCKILQQALLPLVEEEMQCLYQKTKTAFQGNLCLAANASDIKRAPGKAAQFAHRCHSMRSPCNSLLNLIRDITSENVDLYIMLKDTNPQRWLDTPVDFARMFLEDWMRRTMKHFKDFDVSALCHIIMRCRPLMEKCNGATDANIKNVLSLTSRIMRSTMDIGQQDMENGIHDILEALRHFEVLQVNHEITEAKKDIEQLKEENLCLVKDEDRQFEGPWKNIEREMWEKKALMNGFSKKLQEMWKVLKRSEYSLSEIVYTRDTDDAADKWSNTGNRKGIFWLACCVALKYLQHSWMPLVKVEIDRLYQNTVDRFGWNLCSGATITDIRRSDTSRKRGAIFSHANNRCKCNEIVLFIQEKIPESIDAFEMLHRIQPQIWLRSPEDFAKIFMKRAMHQFEDSDISELCYIVSRCKTLKEKIGITRVDEMRKVEIRIMDCATIDMTEKEMEVNTGIILGFVKHLRTLQDSHELSKADDNIKQLIFTIRHAGDVQIMQDLLSDIKVELSRTEDVEAELLRNQDSKLHSCWYKTNMALSHTQSAVQPIVENKIVLLHEKTVKKFGPKPCAKATSNDIVPYKNTAKFQHTCDPGPDTLAVCQELLDIIKKYTADSVDFFSMIKGTDPQTWLDSPIDFVRLFIKKRWRCRIKDFKDCDISALCQIVRRCKPLMLMFDENKLNGVTKVRNQTMHKAKMGITQEEMEDNLAAILDFLKYVKTFNDTEEVTRAIDCVQKLQARDPQFFFRQCFKMIQEVLTDARLTYKDKRAATNELFQNIIYMERELDRLQNIPETPCTVDNDEETAKHGQSQPLSSGDEHLTSTSSGMDSLTMEGFSQPIVKMQRETAEEINKMGLDELRAAILKANEEDPWLVSKVLRPQSSS